MANMDYGASILRIVVAQMCETVGWNSIQTTPLQLLTDVLQRYITEVAENAHRYAEQFGHTRPTLHDLGLAFQDMKINTGDLQEYIEYVATIPLRREVPKYPISKESHLNLLKPGSREVVTRPVHIHEHLPAMYPELEKEDYGQKPSTLTVETSSTEVGSPSNHFKRPGDPVSSISPQLKQARLLNEEEGRPLREISSVMMTTSGFLSPAREGKLPEAHTPAPPSKLATYSGGSSGSSSYPTVPPEVKGEKKTKKKSIKIPKKIDNESKLSDVVDLVNLDDSKVKKLVGMKELSKLKALKSFKLSHSNVSSSLKKLPRIPKIKRKKIGGSKHKKIKHKIPAKSQHLDSTSNIPLIKSDSMENEIDVCGNSEENYGNDDSPMKDTEIKLTSEPDKQKLNIFKKISKVKEDKSEHFDDSVTVEEPKNDVYTEKLSSTMEISQPEEENFQKQDLPHSPMECLPSPPASSNTDFTENAFYSPPGPPRTPEVIIPIKKNKSKKHKKDKTKVKKVKPVKNQNTVSQKLESEPIEEEIIDKPKTPEIEPLKDMKFIPTPSPVFSFFENFPSGPGLIPPQISNLFTPKPNTDKYNTLIPPPMVPVPKIKTPPVPHDLPPIKSQLSPLLPPSPSLISPQPTNAKNDIPPTPETPKTIQLPKTEVIDKPPLFKVKLKEDKKKKEHRSDKKDKIKKKKHKKDKMKNKEEKDGIKKKDKSREKKEKRREEKKREKEKDQCAPVESTSDDMKSSNSGNVPKITLKLSAAEPPPPSEQPHRKIVVIKPVKKPEEQHVTSKEDTQPVKTPHQAKPKSSKKSTLSSAATPQSSNSIDSTTTPIPSSSKPKKPPTSSNFTPQSKESKKPSKEGGEEPQPYYYDESGNQVWICPGCRGPDDGSPMIGCDSCDAWYHWVCVGLQLPPQSSDWFCKYCIARKDTAAAGDKKKKFRKKLLGK
ncbi:transcription initiation factor TFIID subunit 3 [Nilaparvata lugens]|uniref:transcription initiation factor TFIID subunit 3 n=1 Tax=Nilaparvata lugens TaxID=108931 RepID=UPI00193E2BE7|nr:transcription initiation factor TFIID subunit 3 [Nilaparvata lugens]